MWRPPLNKPNPHDITRVYLRKRHFRKTMARLFLGAFLPVFMTAASSTDYDDLCYCSRCGECTSAILTKPNFMAAYSACPLDDETCECATRSTDCCECTVPGAPHTCAGANNCFDPTAGCQPLPCVQDTTCVVGTTLEQLNAPACLGGTCILDYDLCLSYAANTIRLRSSHLIEYGPVWTKARRHRQRHRYAVLTLSLLVAATAACCIARCSLCHRDEDEASKVPLLQHTLFSYGTSPRFDLEVAPSPEEDAEAQPAVVAPAQ